MTSSKCSGRHPTPGATPKPSHIKGFEYLKLADPEGVSGCHVDILLGIHQCNQCTSCNMLLSPDRQFRDEAIIFGWVMGGGAPTANAKLEDVTTFLTLVPRGNAWRRLRPH